MLSIYSTPYMCEAFHFTLAEDLPSCSEILQLSSFFKIQVAYLTAYKKHFFSKKVFLRLIRWKVGFGLLARGVQELQWSLN